MRLSDPVPTRDVVHVFAVLAFAAVLLFITHGLKQPGYALLALVAALAVRIAYVRWRRRAT